MTDPRTLDAALRSDFHTFAAKVFNTLHPSGGLEFNWHLEAITHRLEQVRLGHENRLIINVPPRSLKSLLASVALPAFILGHDPGARLICVSYAQPLASKLSREFRRVLEADWYQRLFPRTVVRKDAEDILETTLCGARLSTSIAAVMTGFGTGTIIIDDPMKPDEAPSEAARERVIKHYREVLFSRLDSKVDGRIIVVMQRLHEDDLSGHLLREPGWSLLGLPAIATADETIPLGNGRTYQRKLGDLLHPSREPRSALDELRRSLGSAAFEAQYQQSPVPASGNMVKKDWLETYRQTPGRENARVTQSWDTALKGDPTNDYSVCTTWSERNGKHYLLDVFRRQLDFPDLIKAVVSQHGQHAPDAVLIEDQGSGTVLIQQLRAQHGIHAIGLRSKDDKVTRLSTVLPMFEARQVFLPEDETWLATLLHELFGFPRTRFDDQVDSLSQYLSWARARASSPFEVDWGGMPTAEEIAYAMLSLPRRRF